MKIDRYRLIPLETLFNEAMRAASDEDILLFENENVILRYRKEKEELSD